MARKICYKSFSYDYIRSLLLYVVFSNLISLIIFIDRDVYNNNNTESYFPLDGFFFTI